MPLFLDFIPKPVFYVIVFVLGVVLIIFIAKLLRTVIERLAAYAVIKRFCDEHSGIMKKDHSIFRSFFSVYPEYDIELDAGGVRYGIKFFPKNYRKKTVVIEAEKKAYLLKHVGTSFATPGRGGMPGHAIGRIINEDTDSKFKIDLSGAEPGVKSLLLFVPMCQRLLMIKKTERVEVCTGDDVFGFTAVCGVKKINEYIR